MELAKAIKAYFKDWKECSICKHMCKNDLLSDYNRYHKSICIECHDKMNEDIVKLHNIGW